MHTAATPAACRYFSHCVLSSCFHGTAKPAGYRRHSPIICVPARLPANRCALAVPESAVAVIAGLLQAGAEHLGKAFPQHRIAAVKLQLQFTIADNQTPMRRQCSLQRIVIRLGSEHRCAVPARSANASGSLFISAIRSR